MLTVVKDLCVQAGFWIPIVIFKESYGIRNDPYVYFIVKDRKL